MPDLTGSHLSGPELTASELAAFGLTASELAASVLAASGLAASGLAASEPAASGLAASELTAEDTKLVTLARAARARIGAAEGAAVRDGDGRTYNAASVALPSLSLTALQLAVASAVSSGASKIEAAAVVTEASVLDDAGHSAVREVSPGAPIHLANPAATVFATILS